MTFPHIPDKEIKAQGGGMACPRFYNYQVAKPGNSVLFFLAPKSGRRKQEGDKKKENARGIKHPSPQTQKLRI